MCGGHRRVQRYPTDLTEAEWTILAPLIPAAKPGGRPRTTDMREVVNAIFYSPAGRMPMAPAPERVSALPDRLSLFLDVALGRRLGADARQPPWGPARGLGPHAGAQCGDHR